MLTFSTRKNGNWICPNGCSSGNVYQWRHDPKLVRASKKFPGNGCSDEWCGSLEQGSNPLTPYPFGSDGTGGTWNFTIEIASDWTAGFYIDGKHGNEFTPPIPLYHFGEGGNCPSNGNCGQYTASDIKSFRLFAGRGYNGASVNVNSDLGHSAG